MVHDLVLAIFRNFLNEDCLEFCRQALLYFIHIVIVDTTLQTD